MKAIKLTQSMKQQIINGILNNKERFVDNKITIDFNKSIRFNKEVHILFKEEAYNKVLEYVKQCNSEVAWHMVVKKVENSECLSYQVLDAMAYPQKVTGVTVEAIEDKYASWMNNLNDETFNNLRGQGHSHVEMGVTPSGTDRNMYNNYLKGLEENDFYMFMIINKKGDIWFEIHDLEKNIIFEKADIKVITPYGHLQKEVKEELDSLIEKVTWESKGWGNKTISTDKCGTCISYKNSKCRLTNKKVGHLAVACDKYLDKEDMEQGYYQGGLY